MTPNAPPAEDRRVAYAHAASGLLRRFNEAGVLGLADVHTADRVGRICGETDERVLLALALVVRALRRGSVCLELASAQQTMFDEAEESIDTSGLPWPDPASWLELCARSPMVTVGPDRAGTRPLRLNAGLLYLERYWLQEETVRRQLQARWSGPAPALDRDRARAALARLFDGRRAPDGVDRQRLAAAVAALSPVSVIAGGPGTGKTTTVAAVLSLLADQPGRPPRIALAAPTGKAAARLTEAVARARDRLAPSESAAPGSGGTGSGASGPAASGPGTAGSGTAGPDRLPELTAQTLHRLLGWLPGSRGRFRHDARNHLPYDVIVVDEASMVSLTLMARLLEAIRPTARLVLVGDPDQLSPVEAGAVLADVVRAEDTAPGEPELAQALTELGPDPGSRAAPRRVVTLDHVYRFGDGGAIDTLAKAVRSADPAAVLDALRTAGPEVEFVEVDPGVPGMAVGRLADQVRDAGRRRIVAAEAGDVVGALAAIEVHRLLCAHRRGPYGVSRWSDEAERWLELDTDRATGRGTDGEWYLGRPVLVTANDYELGLYNGDIGVVVATPTGPRVAFARGSGHTLIAPVRLDSVQTVHAMTVHRAQGSQFDGVSFIVPPADSPLLTRELLYTAVTRASRRVQVFGTADAIERAVLRPANRASGLADRL